MIDREKKRLESNTSLVEGPQNHYLEMLFFLADPRTTWIFDEDPMTFQDENFNKYDYLIKKFKEQPEKFKKLFNDLKEDKTDEGNRFIACLYIYLVMDAQVNDLDNIKKVLDYFKGVKVKHYEVSLEELVLVFHRNCENGRFREEPVGADERLQTLVRIRKILADPSTFIDCMISQNQYQLCEYFFSTFNIKEKRSQMTQLGRRALSKLRHNPENCLHRDAVYYSNLSFTRDEIIDIFKIQKNHLVSEEDYFDSSTNPGYKSAYPILFLFSILKNGDEYCNTFSLFYKLAQLHHNCINQSDNRYYCADNERNDYLYKIEFLIAYCMENKLENSLLTLIHKSINYRDFFAKPVLKILKECCNEDNVEKDKMILSKNDYTASEKCQLMNTLLATLTVSGKSQMVLCSTNLTQDGIHGKLTLLQYTLLNGNKEQLSTLIGHIKNNTDDLYSFIEAELISRKDKDQPPCSLVDLIQHHMNKPRVGDNDVSDDDFKAKLSCLFSEFRDDEYNKIVKTIAAELKKSKLKNIDKISSYWQSIILPVRQSSSTSRNVGYVFLKEQRAKQCDDDDFNFSKKSDFPTHGL